VELGDSVSRTDKPVSKELGQDASTCVSQIHEEDERSSQTSSLSIASRASVHFVEKNLVPWRRLSLHAKVGFVVTEVTHKPGVEIDLIQPGESVTLTRWRDKDRNSRTPPPTSGDRHGVDSRGLP
jgi:hypothetical protein